MRGVDPERQAGCSEQCLGDIWAQVDPVAVVGEVNRITRGSVAAGGKKAWQLRAVSAVVVIQFTALTCRTIDGGSAAHGIVECPLAFGAEH